MIKICTTILFFALPCAAYAQSTLERLEAASETMSLEMTKLMVREIERKGGDSSGLMEALPNTEWDEEHRQAGTCMLGKYEALIGANGVEAMVTNMQEMIAKVETATMDTIEELNMLPEGVTQEQSGQISNECGLIELSLRRMKESGFSDAMMKAYSTIPDSN